MKLRKFIQTLFSILTCCILTLTLAGCLELSGPIAPVGIVSIQKTSSSGLVDVYTITYTNGKTSTFEVTNGKDGANGADGLNGMDGKDGTNGQNVTALELYETYKDIYGEDLSYAEFLSIYLKLDGTSREDACAVINDCLQSVGKLYCEFEEADTSENAKHPTKLAVYTGACVIYQIDSDYTYFITNYHVVYDEDAVEKHISETIHCYLYGTTAEPTKKTDVDGYNYCEYTEEAIPCTYVGGSVEYDIAIIKAETSTVLGLNKDVKPITFALSYHVGQTAIAIGNPNGDGISVTQGIVSVDNEYISLDIDGKSRSYRSVRIDTALYGGNSGGGLFNGKGELIGIANAGNVTDQNINFAVPVQIVKGVAENIMLHEADGDENTNGAYKIKLGVTVFGKNSKYTYDPVSGFGEIKEDILISEVTENGIAAKIGLKKDDVIKAIVVDGQRYDLKRYFEIGDHILRLTKDVSFSFVCVRDGQEKTTATHTVAASDLNFVE